MADSWVSWVYCFGENTRRSDDLTIGSMIHSRRTRDKSYAVDRRSLHHVVIEVIQPAQLPPALFLFYSRPTECAGVCRFEALSFLLAAACSGITLEKGGYTEAASALSGERQETVCVSASG